MAEENFDKLLEQSSQTDFQVLLGAKEDAKRKVLEEATPANLAALDKATRMLEAHRMGKALKDKEAKGQVDRWKSKADVLAYLQAAGWDIEKSTFYNHSKPEHKDGGKLNKVKGWYLKTHVDAYANQYLVKVDGAGVADEGQTALQKEKLQGEVRYQDVRTQKAQLELDILRGKYFPIDQFDLELAGRAGVLDSSFRHLIQSRAQEVVALVGGDQQKAQDLVNYMLGKWDGMLAEYASNKEFQVIVKPKVTEERT